MGSTSTKAVFLSIGIVVALLLAGEWFWIAKDKLILNYKYSLGLSCIKWG
jgi:hypothetical protein